jgi:DNA ligase-1
MNTIYKRDSKGNVRSWIAEVEDDHWRTVAGLLDGNLVTSGWRKSDAKNIGKLNETTGHEQALAESNAKLKKQLEQGYFIRIEDIDNGNLFKPMLAADYAKLKKPVQFPVYSQPKLDGIRCIARKDGLWSRSGKPITSIPHIWESLSHHFIKNPNLILDGELYNHELKDDFNKIVSLVRKEDPSPEELAESRELVQYHVYDIYEEGSFESRDESYHAVVDSIGDFIYAVPSTLIATQVELDDTYGDYLEKGYEGQMVRLNGEYENKRSKNLLKRKEFSTAEFDVVEVLEGKGNWSGCAKKIVIKLADGTTCEAGCRGSQAAMAKLLNGPKPEWATVRYFGFTPDGKLRFGVMIDHGFGQRED